MGPKPDWVVFVSHSGIDTWVAKQIAWYIQGCGATPFLDEANIAAGEDFEERILVALDQAKELLLLLTPWSITRPYVLAELGAAWFRRIPIITVLHGLTANDVQSKPELPIFIKRRDFVELNGIQTYFDELCQRVRQ